MIMRLMQNEDFVFRPGMAKRADSTKEWKPIHRLAFAFFGLVLVGSGSLTLLSGKLHYRNHWLYSDTGNDMRFEPRPSDRTD